MAASKPNFIKKFWPVYQIQASRTGQYKRILAERMERSKYLIENNFGVKADRVVDTFIRAYLASDKDYPAPIDSVANPQSTRDYSLYEQYIIFLWQYYVKDKSKKPKIPKEDEPKGVKNNTEKTDTSSPGALTLYEGTREEDLVDEQIDERILKLLGLQDIFDIDYGTYLSLLKERLVTISMGSDKIPREEQILLQNEFKRVKGKVGRFKIKSKKINADNIGVSGPIRVSRQQFFLAGKVSVPDLSNDKLNIGSSLKKDIQAIKESIISIASLLTEQSNLFKKQLEEQRKSAENLKRSQKESGLESKTDKLKALASKILSPVKGFLDKIMNFIVWTLLGRLMYKFIDWISDPKNKKKLDLLVRFIGDWWPALLAGFVLFATPLGSFVRTVIGTVTKLTVALAKKGIPKLLQFIKGNPKTALLIAGATAAGVGAYMATQQAANTRKEDKKKDPSVVLPEDTAKTGAMPGPAQLTKEQIQTRGLNMFRGGGLIKKKPIEPQKKTTNIKNIGFEGGGPIDRDTGVKITGAGKDTQLIAARPGEVVISKEAVDTYGANFFLALNKSGGGTNVPKMVNNIQLAAGGGMVGGITMPSMLNNVQLSTGGLTGIIRPESTSSSKTLQSPRPKKLTPKNYESDYIKKSAEYKPQPITQSLQTSTSSQNHSKTIDPTHNHTKDNKSEKFNSNVQDSKTTKYKTSTASNNSKSSFIPRTSINYYYYPSPDVLAMLIPVEKMKPMAETAKESAKPIEQKMPFVVPLINNIVNVLTKTKEDKQTIQKPNVNIRPNIKNYVPEPPVKKSGSNLITLPPLNTSDGSKGYSPIPQQMSTIRDITDFPAFLPSPHRKNNIQIYGIAGVV